MGGLGWALGAEAARGSARNGATVEAACEHSSAEVLGKEAERHSGAQRCRFWCHPQSSIWKRFYFSSNVDSNFEIFLLITRHQTTQQNTQIATHVRLSEEKPRCSVVFSQSRGGQRSDAAGGSAPPGSAHPHTCSQATCAVTGHSRRGEVRPLPRLPRSGALPGRPSCPCQCSEAWGRGAEEARTELALTRDADICVGTGGVTSQAGLAQRHC